MNILGKISKAFGGMKGVSNRSFLDKGGFFGFLGSHPSGGHTLRKEIKLELLGKRGATSKVANQVYEGAKAGKSSKEILSGMTTKNKEEIIGMVKDVGSDTNKEYFNRAAFGKKWVRTPKSEADIDVIQIKKEADALADPRNKDIYKGIRRDYANELQDSGERSLGKFNERKAEILKRRDAARIRPTFTTDELYNWKSSGQVLGSRAGWTAAGVGVVGTGTVGAAVYRHETENYQQYRPSLAGNTPLAGDGSMGLTIHNNRRPY
jgi:hypothetical protein